MNRYTLYKMKIKRKKQIKLRLILGKIGTILFAIGFFCMMCIGCCDVELSDMKFIIIGSIISCILLLLGNFLIKLSENP